MIDDDKPSLAELRHFGVLGMKWGTTRAKANSGEINAARRRQERTKRKIDSQQQKVNKLTPGTKEHTKEKKALTDITMENLKNPDRVIAARMTRAEKFLVGSLGLAIGTTTAPVAIPVALGSIAGTSARSRRIERQQEKGAFDKKK